MPKIALDISHSIGQTEARRRLEKALAASQVKFRDQLKDFKEEWLDHTCSFGFSAMGMAISGTIAVEQECVRLAAQLPFAAMLFKGTIESRIRQEAERLLQGNGKATEPG
jgi:hypothetical protein